MSEQQQTWPDLRRNHPLFFWGMAALVGLVIAATVVVAVRIPVYRADAAVLDERMTVEERETRDRILEARSKRAEMALILWRRELQLKAMRESGVHLALDVEEAVLELRHGAATLRQVPVSIGGDSVVTAPDGRSWRFVQARGERKVQAKETSASYLVPEWVYLSRGQEVPPESERRVEGGLGRYLLRLDDGTEIYSRPERGPHAERVKPAAYMVEEQELRAIFEAIPRGAPVYIY